MIIIVAIIIILTVVLLAITIIWFPVIIPSAGSETGKWMNLVNTFCSLVLLNLIFISFHFSSLNQHNCSQFSTFSLSCFLFLPLVKTTMNLIVIHYNNFKSTIQLWQVLTFTFTMIIVQLNNRVNVIYTEILPSLLKLAHPDHQEKYPTLFLPLTFT